MGSLSDAPRVLTARSDYPELCLEWLPTRGPGAADGEWCDITSYVADFSCRRGRQYETDRFEAGTMSVTLKATTRLFDPENPAGPFYPWLAPMRQIRLTAVWNGALYPVWRGYVRSWGQTVPADKLFITTIACEDGFYRLERVKLPSSAWALEVQKDDPSLWFRLGETDTPRVTDSSDGGNYGIYDNCQQGVAGLVPNDADGACGFAHSQEERVAVQNPSLISGYPFTIEALIRIGSDHPTGRKIIWAGFPGAPTSVNSDNGMWLGIDPTFPGQLMSHVRNSGAQRRVVTNDIVANGVPHHVTWIAASSSSHLLYIDGVAATTTTVSSGSPSWISSPTNGYTIGNVTDIGLGDYGFGNNLDGDDADLAIPHLDFERGTIDEIVVWDAASIAATRIAAHSLAAKSGWDGDDTGARVTRFLDAIGWPSTLRDIDTGISILGPASWSAGSSALSALQGWANTELGGFFMGKDGKLVWRSRHFPYLDSTATVSQATFGDAHSGEALTYRDEGFALPRDETLIRNPVTASRVGGVSVTVSDPALCNPVDGKYGDRTWDSPTTEDQKDSAVRDRALWLLARYKEQSSRLAKMTLVPRSNASGLWPQVLGRELGERITVKRMPLGLNSEIVSDQIIEAIEHSGSPMQWETTFTGSPVDPNVGDYLILDDATYGLLDTGVLAY